MVLVLVPMVLVLVPMVLVLVPLVLDTLDILEALSALSQLLLFQSLIKYVIPTSKKLKEKYYQVIFYTWCDLVNLQYVQNKKGKQAMSREEMMKLIYTHARIMKPYILQLQFVVKKLMMICCCYLI